MLISFINQWIESACLQPYLEVFYFKQGEQK